jgi:NAD(P)-dependent dehydrogenase (short-subunit alcohol dehydrogenase family)
VERFGGIDAFFNNAGIYGSPHPMPEYPVELFERILSVNVVGVWLGMRAVMAAMAEKGGAIVNTSSIAGLRGYGNLGGYIASKHAVLGLTKVGAAEGGPQNIRVNAVCPGLIDTAMGDQVKAGMDDFDGFMSRVTPMNRVGTPAEVADAVCFLLSDDARFVSGAALTIDGGITATG